MPRIPERKNVVMTQTTLQLHCTTESYEKHGAGSITYKVCLQDGPDHPWGQGDAGGKGELKAEEETPQGSDAARAWVLTFRETMGFKVSRLALLTAL